ncbi:MAG: trigger factor [Acidobacteria bacterium]|nr:MAG: trigger factor [Acidobacteriota bacterium]
MDIRVELVDVSTVKKKLKVEVPAEITQKKFDEIAEEYKKRIRIPGFRPGKAPVTLVKRRFHKDIRTDVIQQMIPDSYEQAIKEKGVEPLTEPHLESMTYEEGQPLVYEAHFETRPQISVPNYKGLEIQAAALTITDEDVQAELEKLRDKHARLTPVEDRPIQAGDFAVIDMHGEHVLEEGHPRHHDHEAIDEENVTVEVGGERTHEAFTGALVGMNIAQEKTFDVTYPPDYPQKELAGHTVRFTVEVADIKKKELPELNDEFAREVSLESLDALKEKIRSEVTEFREKNRENEVKKKLVAKLAEAAPFEVPETLVDSRLDDRLRDLTYDLASQGVDIGKVKLDWKKVRDELRPEAEKDVRVAMILTEVAKAEQIEVSDDDIEDELEQMAKSLKQPKEKVRQLVQKQGGLEGLRGQIQRRKALDFVYEQTNVSA